MGPWARFGLAGVSAPDRGRAFRGFAVAATLGGSMAWKAFTVPEEATGAAIWSSMSIDVGEGRTYATTGNNYAEPATDTSDAFMAFDVEDGSVLWTNQRLAGDVWPFGTGSDLDFAANPILFEAQRGGVRTRLVAAGQKSGEIHVLDRERDGEEVCRRALSQGSATSQHGIFNNGAWDGEHLLFAANGAASDAPGSEPPDSPSSGQAVLFAIDPATCDIVWERQLPGRVMAPITVANGVGFVGADRRLQAFDTSTGEKLFDYLAPATIGSTPTVADGRVAFGAGMNWIGTSPGTFLVVLALP
jgi:polyvinyl alcohol dehydrogenase (cytochrome)